MKKLMLIYAFVLLTPVAGLAQGTGFNFQGRLNDGTNPANGHYDLQFRLYDALTGGGQIGVLVSRPNTVLVNGVFSTTLDFGAAAFNNPNNIFIEIGIRPNGSPNAFTILGPRQQLTAVPFAVRATNADNATLAVNAQHSVDAQLAVTAQNAITANSATLATTAQNANALGGVAPAGWARLNVQNTGDVLLTGRLQITGNSTQSLLSYGMPKAMAVVAADRTIIRCFNGVTGSSTGTCGFISTPGVTGGIYQLDFGFTIDDRFISVTAQQTHTVSGGVYIGTGYNFFSDHQTLMVKTFITNVEFSGALAANPFTVIVY